MKRLTCSFSLLLVVALVLSGCQLLLTPDASISLPPSAASQSTLDEATVAAIDAYVEEMMALHRLPGFALAVVQDGDLAYAQGYGVTSVDDGEPVTPATPFQWCETTMAFTAMAALQLAEAGKLDLDAPVTEYLPYFSMQDAHDGDITVRHILMSMSGIPDSGDAMADWDTFMPQFDPGASERWVRNELANTGLLFVPGEGFEYSDMAFALLGDVIAKVSGQPYEAYMAEHVLQPLGMANSTFLLEEVDKAHLAVPHKQYASGQIVPGKTQPYHRPFGAANNLFASVEDVARFAQAALQHGELADQRVLSEASFQEMWTPYSPTPFADFTFGSQYPTSMMLDWGYGWFLGEVAGHVAPNTFGGEYGYQAGTLTVPDLNMAIVAVGNGPTDEGFYASDAAADVMGLLLAEDDD